MVKERERERVQPRTFVGLVQLYISPQYWLAETEIPADVLCEWGQAPDWLSMITTSFEQLGSAVSRSSILSNGAGSVSRRALYLSPNFTPKGTN